MLGLAKTLDPTYRVSIERSCGAGIFALEE